MKLATINDRELIDSFYKKSNSELGYNSFCGTYSTCIGHGEELYYDIIFDEIFLYILKDPNTDEKSVVPLYLGDSPENAGLHLKTYCKENKITSGVYIDGSHVKYLKSTFNITQTDDSEHEALYPIERFKEFKLIETQKRRANIFFRNNKYQFSEYKEAHKASILQLCEYWEENSTHPTDRCDNIITEFFVDNYTALPIMGFSLFKDENIIGYLFGEIINNETFVVNVIKARMDIKGAYQALINLVTSHPTLNKVKFINYTNLTNVSGLREMKLRLKPEKLIVPWIFDC